MSGLAGNHQHRSQINVLLETSALVDLGNNMIPTACLTSRNGQHPTFYLEFNMSLNSKHCVFVASAGRCN